MNKQFVNTVEEGSKESSFQASSSDEELFKFLPKLHRPTKSLLETPDLIDWDFKTFNHPSTKFQRGNVCPEEEFFKLTFLSKLLVHPMKNLINEKLSSKEEYWEAIWLNIPFYNYSSFIT